MHNESHVKPGGITLLIPVLNEIEGLRALVPSIDRSLFDEIIMIDGGSTDGSADWARSSGIKVVAQRRADLSYLIVDVLDEIHTEYIIGFSPDGNCKVDDLPRLAAKLREGYDVVIMSRYLAGARSEDDTPVTAFGNWMFSRMARYLGNFPLTDVLNMFRGYRVALMHDPWYRRFMIGPIHEPLLISIATLRRLRIVEIPADEPPRIGGSSKMRVLYNGSFILLLFIRLHLFRLRNAVFPETGIAARKVGKKEPSEP
jgi:glycosyltransferase involved in cell wall biosynthesis